jgi:hypothetical protein
VYVMPNRSGSCVNGTLTGSPQDSPPSSLANTMGAATCPSRQLLQSAKRAARHSACPEPQQCKRIYSAKMAATRSG